MARSILVLKAFPPERRLASRRPNQEATRTQLRKFFQVDRYHITVAAIAGLVADGVLKPALLEKAQKKYGINADAPASWTI